MKYQKIYLDCKYFVNDALIDKSGKIQKLTKKKKRDEWLLPQTPYILDLRQADFFEAWLS